MAKDTFQNAVNDFYKPRPAGYDRDVVKEWPPSLARQEFAEECDINTIMARYETTGQLPVSGAQPRYLDLAFMPETLMETLAVLKEAEAAFMRLPARVRREFDNDAVAFAEYALNGENLEQLREWGLAEPAPAPQPNPAPTPASSPASAPEAPKAP